MNQRHAADRASRFAAILLVSCALLAGASGCSSGAGADRDAAQFAGAKELYDAGDFAQSEDALNQLLERAPDNAEALRTLALAQAAQGKNEEAITRYARLVELDPKDHSSWYRMALLERIVGQADTSAEHLQMALDADPGNRSYTDELARTKMSLGKYADAAQLWGGLLEDEKLPKESHRELLVLQGQALQAAKDYEAAEKAFKAALKLYPKDKDLKAKVRSFQ